MAILAAIGTGLKIIFFFLNLWREKDKKKAKKKAEIGKEIIDAFAETSKKKRASRLNAAVGRINRLRKKH
jgi:hypothetical protein